MKISRIPVGMLQVNCYIVIDEKTGDSAIIDPGGNEDLIIKQIDNLKCNVKAILLTHGHFDHTEAVIALSQKFNVPVYINKLDYDLAVQGVSDVFYIKNIKEGVFKYIDENSLINIGNLEIKTICTPGHTPGGVCFYVENILISGDTLFAGSIGRSDFFGGNHNTLIKSIKDKLMGLPDETIVLPGHGPESKIINEKLENPYLT